jgi:hypothetical protein
VCVIGNSGSAKVSVTNLVGEKVEQLLLQANKNIENFNSEKKKEIQRENSEDALNNLLLPQLPSYKPDIVDSTVNGLPEELKNRFNKKVSTLEICKGISDLDHALALTNPGIAAFLIQALRLSGGLRVLVVGLYMLC